MAGPIVEFVLKARDDARVVVEGTARSVEKLAAVAATASRTPIIHESLMPKIQAVSGETERLAASMAALGQVAQRALSPAEQEALRLARGISAAGRGIFATNEQFHQFLMNVRGFSADKILEFEKRVAELLPRALGKSEAAAIRAADSFRTLDVAADRVLRREMRGDLTKRILALGERGAPLMFQVRTKATVEELTQLERKIGILEGRMKSGAATARGFGASLKGIGGQALSALGPVGAAGIGGFLGGIAGTAITQGIQRLDQAVKHAIQSVRELALEQRRIGVEKIETGLSVEALETLRHGSQTLGIEIGSLQMGMRMLAQNLTEKREAFEALGIATLDSSGQLRGVGDVLVDLMGVFAGMTNETARLQLASELMGGRMAARLLPMLVLGKKGFADLAAEGRGLGVILGDDVDKALVAHARQISTTGQAWKGLGNELRIAVLPIFGAIDRVSRKTAEGIRSEVLLTKRIIEGLADVRLPSGLGGPVVLDPARQVRRVEEPPAMISAHQAQEAERASARVEAALDILKGSSGKTKETIDDLFKSVGRLATTDRDVDRLAASFSGARTEIERMLAPVERGGQAIERAIVERVIQRAPLVHAALAGDAASAYERVPDKIKAIDLAMSNLGRRSIAAREEIEDLAGWFERLLEVTTRQQAAATLFNAIGRDAGKAAQVIAEVEARAAALWQEMNRRRDERERDPLGGLPVIETGVDPEQQAALDRMMKTLERLRGPENIRAARDLFLGVPEAWERAAAEMSDVVEDMGRSAALQEMRPLLTRGGLSREDRTALGQMLQKDDVQEFVASLDDVLNSYNLFSRSMQSISQAIFSSFQTVFTNLIGSTQTFGSALLTIASSIVQAVLAELSKLVAAGFLRLLASLLPGGGSALSLAGGAIGSAGSGQIVGGYGARRDGRERGGDTYNIYALDARSVVMSLTQPGGEMRRAMDRVVLAGTY